MLGSGTELDPYVITTIEEFQAIADDMSAYYVLGNDIDASGFAFVPFPITSPFYGQLDGKGHVVNGLSISVVGEVNHATIFPAIIGTVKSIGFEGVNFSSKWIADGLCLNVIGTIENVYVRGSLTAKKATNGLSFANQGTIINCYSAVTMSAPAKHGLCGYNTGSFVSCYWDTETSGAATSVGGTGKTTAEMKAYATFTDWWTPPTPWTINNGVTYPFFAQQSTVTSVTPSFAMRPKTLDVSIHGTNLLSVTGVTIGDITINSTTLDSSIHVTVNITIDDTTALGPRDIIVTTLFGDINFPAAFTVYAQIVPTVYPLPLATSISFSTGAFDAPVWEDIHEDILDISITRGRNDEMDKIETSTATIVLDNRSGEYWPGRVDGSHYPNIRPLKQIQVVRTHNYTIYGLFNGLIESWQPSFLEQNGMLVPIITISCVDILSSLGKAGFPVTTFAQELSDTRINNALTIFGWTGGRLIDAGQREVQAFTTAADASILAHIQDVADSEGGQFFIDGSGNAVFHDRDHRMNTTISALFTLSDCALGVAELGKFGLGEGGENYSSILKFGYPSEGNIGYVGLDYSYDDKFIFNDIHITIVGGIEQVAQDAACMLRDGTRTLPKTGLLLTTDAEALKEALYRLYLYREPHARITSLSVIARPKDQALFAAVYGFEIGQQITISLPEAGLDTGFYIEGMTHTWSTKSPNIWTTQWQLSIAEPVFWILEDPIYGVYGETTRMG